MRLIAQIGILALLGFAAVLYHYSHHGLPTLSVVPVGEPKVYPASNGSSTVCFLVAVTNNTRSTLCFCVGPQVGTNIISDFLERHRNSPVGILGPRSGITADLQYDTALQPLFLVAAYAREPGSLETKYYWLLNKLGVSERTNRVQAMIVGQIVAPMNGNSELDGAADRSQPVRLATNYLSAAAGSGR